MHTKVMRPKVVVFDFDGVIVPNSEFFKAAAWKEVFAPHTGTYEPFLVEAGALFGWGKRGDRFDVLRYVLTKLDVPLTDEAVQSRAEVFDVYVQKAILEAGVVPDAHEFLVGFKERYPIYLNSGTAQSGLDVSVTNLGIGAYFKKVIGGPASKADTMRAIASEEQVALSDMLLVGDTQGDFTVSLETGCQFVGVANEWNKWKKSSGHTQEGAPQYEQEVSFPLIGHIRELEGLLV